MKLAGEETGRVMGNDCLRKGKIKVTNFKSGPRGRVGIDFLPA